ncbi:MAG: HAMP domain-containing protein [Rhodospirillaceae bacterium]|nr:HAMP domain-containing protein [Rhodospirillales bacterium]
MTIKVRLYLLVGLMTAAFLAMAGFNYWSATRVDAAAALQRENAREGKALQGALQAAKNVHLAVLKAMAATDPKDVDRQFKAMKASGTELARLVGEAGSGATGDRAAQHVKVADNVNRMLAAGKGVEEALVNGAGLEKLPEYQAGVQAGEATIGEAYGALGAELQNEITTADANLTAALDRSITFAAVSAVLATLVTIGLGLFLFRSIVLPLREMAEAMRRLAAGDTSVTVRGGEVQDEMGAMARALAVFREHAVEVVTLHARETETAKKVEEERRARAQQLVDQVLATLAQVSKARHRQPRNRCRRPIGRSDLGKCGNGGCRRRGIVGFHQRNQPPSQFFHRHCPEGGQSGHPRDLDHFRVARVVKQHR